MLFSNFVATIRADLDAIKDDLGEFVTVVKSDTTAILGLAPGNGGNNNNSSTSMTGGILGGNKVVQWDEELYDNPDLMCEDPVGADDWETFLASNPVKEDEVEMMLSGSYSDLIPELYRELVPSRTTHADFFKRLVYHRNRLTQAMKTKVHELVREDEEETGWEDDDDEPAPAAKQQTAKSDVVAHPPAKIVQVDNAALEEARRETTALKEELERVKEELAKSQTRIESLERMLEDSETARKSLAMSAEVELPHKKAAPSAAYEEKQQPGDVEVASPPSIVEEEEEERVDTPATVKSTIAPSVATASWEALPTSPASSSNEEPVMLSKTDELEEDDWE